MSTCISVYFCIIHSRQLAEEVMRGGASDEEEGGAPVMDDQGFEGMEALARAIELGQFLASLI